MGSAAPSLYDSITFSTLIFDLGGVMFSWSAEKIPSVSLKSLQRLMDTDAWYNFEKCRTTQDECYAKAIQELHLDITVSRLTETFDKARETLQTNTALVGLLKELKAQHGVKLIAMSNISKPDHDFVRERCPDLALFDRIFTSCGAGRRKPDVNFFEHVVHESRLDPWTTIFVDDKLDNVLTARSLGMQGIVFHNVPDLTKALRRHLGNPIQQGDAFLAVNAGSLLSSTNTGHILKENFAQLLIWEATGNRDLTDLEKDIGDIPGKINFFRGSPSLTTAEYPCDLDTTAIGLTVGDNQAHDQAHQVLDEMLKYCNDDGILRVYFDDSRPRIDPVVCVNALTAFHAFGRGNDVIRTMQWVRDVLANRAYLDGTRYYTTSEAFLFFSSRLISRSDKARLKLGTLLRQRVSELIGSTGDALALAMRVLTCAAVDLRDDIDLDRLLDLQLEDGGWPEGWLYRYGVTGTLVGNRGLATALSVNAIKAMEGLPRSL